MMHIQPQEQPVKKGEITEQLKVQNPQGIHARPAALFVKTASRFMADISVEKDGQTVSGKSIMGLLTLEGYQGSTLRVTAIGGDAAEAIAALRELFEKHFYE